MTREGEVLRGVGFCSRYDKSRVTPRTFLILSPLRAERGQGVSLVDALAGCGLGFDRVCFPKFDGLGALTSGCQKAGEAICGPE